MKLLVLSYEYPPVGGGGAKVVYGLSRELARRGHTIDLYTMAYRGLPWRENHGNFTIRRIPSVRLNPFMCTIFEMMPYVFFEVLYLLFRLKRNEYPLIHAHFIFPDGLVAYIVSQIKGIPYVITAHGSDVPGYNPNRFKVLHRILRPFWNVIVKNASSIIPSSESLNRLILKYLPEARTTMIPYGFDFDRFNPNQPRKNRILIVTRMFERKGVQFVLEALKEMDTNFETHILGDGSYLETLKKLARDFNVPAVFHGFVSNESDEFKEFLETAKIFVLPSEMENFPVALLEAMAAGCAIITTSGTGCAEVVGDASLLVPPRDAKAIRAALEKLCSNDELCLKLGQQARTRIEDHFSWGKIADQCMELFEKCKRKKVRNEK